MSGAHEPARADREATDWMILLQEDSADADLRSRFDAWLVASPIHAAAWAETQRVSRMIAATPMHARQGISPTVVRARGDARRRRRGHASRSPGRIWKFPAVAAAACLMLVAGPELLLRMRADAIAGTGDVKALRLADGTAIKLAPGGALAIRFADGERQVQLLRGTAYFDVAHDPRHPFRIGTGETTTTVLGTAFEVRREDAGAAVAVRRGLVRVSCDHAPQSELLAAGLTADLACGHGSSRGALEPGRVAAWTDGQLVATSRSMREVIDGIRPWYRGIIVARGAGIDRRRVTGVYNLRDPQGALDALAAAHHARVRRITPLITVISAD